jgi:hypothetical protein
MCFVLGGVFYGACAKSIVLRALAPSLAGIYLDGLQLAS